MYISRVTIDLLFVDVLADLNFGGYYAPSAPIHIVHQAQSRSQIPQYGPVPTPRSGLRRPRSAPSPASILVDLTDESPVSVLKPASDPGSVDISNQSAAAEEQVAKKIEATPATRVRSDSAAWRKGRAYLDKQLNSQSSSDASRLFESMKALAFPVTRNRYCETHWPTEKAAYDDIVKMSRWFLDADEMVLYVQKWDRVSENVSEEQRAGQEKLLSEIAEEKNALELALPGKRRIKLNRESDAQYSNWVGGMKGPEFEKRFGVKKSRVSIKRVTQEKDADTSDGGAHKKRRTGARSPFDAESPPKAKSSGKPKSVGKARRVSAAVLATEPVEEMDSDGDAEGETDDKVVIGGPDGLFQQAFELELEADLAASFLEDELAATEAANSTPTVEEEAVVAALPVSPFTETPTEKVTAPTLHTATPQEENTMAVGARPDEEIDYLFEDEDEVKRDDETRE